MNSSWRGVLLLLLASAIVACGGGGGGGGGGKGPVARVTVTPASGAVPLTITASGETSSDSRGSIVSYAWNFGDGATDTGVRVSHTYATVGEYVVQLTITDDKGKTAAASTSVVATGNTAVYNGSVYGSANYQDEPASGTLDSTPLQ
jgi:PKD repeat protein